MRAEQTTRRRNNLLITYVPLRQAPANGVYGRRSGRVNLFGVFEYTSHSCGPTKPINHYNNTRGHRRPADRRPEGRRPQHGGIFTIMTRGHRSRRAVSIIQTRKVNYRTTTAPNVFCSECLGTARARASSPYRMVIMRVVTPGRTYGQSDSWTAVSILLVLNRFYRFDNVSRRFSSTQTRCQKFRGH